MCIPARINSDQELGRFLNIHDRQPVLIQYGSSWCLKCVEFLPTFYKLTKKYPKLTYAVAQVDNMQESVKHIRFSPTFELFRAGKRVDQVVGKDAQKLEDHLWLHSDDWTIT
mmetsp:Transcript_891/g.1333  ORF Transcript_891/g.1333 Transcript_891/m.1333 type:complete len:112 (+) Transcript_891:28-363(+)